MTDIQAQELIDEYRRTLARVDAEMDERVSIHDIAEAIGVNYPTIHRWSEKGLQRKYPPHDTIKLKLIPFGGRKRTTRRWVEEFLIAVHVPTSEVASPSREAEGRRVSAHEIAVANLEANGI